MGSGDLSLRGCSVFVAASPLFVCVFTFAGLQFMQRRMDGVRVKRTKQASFAAWNAPKTILGPDDLGCACQLVQIQNIT